MDKNDLSAVKAEPKDLLTGKKPGRKPKPLAEKEKETVILKITTAELENLRKHADGRPLGTFIKRHLREKTTMFR